MVSTTSGKLSQKDTKNEKIKTLHCFIFLSLTSRVSITFPSINQGILEKDGIKEKQLSELITASPSQIYEDHLREEGQEGDGKEAR